MIYRMRVYDTVRENLQVFHEFFRDHLLPVQLHHGARLVGRWETSDGRVVAIPMIRGQEEIFMTSALGTADS